MTDPVPDDPTTGRLVHDLAALSAQLPADKRGGAPALQWFVKQWLGDREILRMDPLSRGVHHHLLMLAWQEPSCGLPNDLEELRDWSDLERVAGRFRPNDGMIDVDQWWKRVWRQVGRVWHPVDDRLYNRGLLRARLQQLRYRQRSLAGVQARLQKPIEKPTVERPIKKDAADVEPPLSSRDRAPPREESSRVTPKSDLTVTTLPSASAAASASASTSASADSSQLQALVDDALHFAQQGDPARAARLLSAVLVPKSRVRNQHARRLTAWAERGIDVEPLLRHAVAVAARQELLGEPVRTWSYLQRCLDVPREDVPVETTAVDDAYVEHLRRRLDELDVPARARKLASVALTVARSEADVLAVKRGMEGV